MGRYYNGDISGKFWFGIQDSNDIHVVVVQISKVLIIAIVVIIL